jgi:hypothetical protein
VDAQQQTPENDPSPAGEPITLAQVLGRINSPERVERFAAGEQDAVIDEVVAEIAKGPLPDEKRRILKSGTLAEIMQVVADETEGRGFAAVPVCLKPVC